MIHTIMNYGTERIHRSLLGRYLVMRDLIGVVRVAGDRLDEKSSICDLEYVLVSVTTGIHVAASSESGKSSY